MNPQHDAMRQESNTMSSRKYYSLDGCEVLEVSLKDDTVLLEIEGREIRLDRHYVTKLQKFLAKAATTLDDSDE